MAISTTFASLSPFEKLPFFVLESVSEYLAHSDSKRRSLFAFSLASKRCCFATTRQRFERIRFRMWGRKKLLQDVNRSNEILRIGERLQCVRRIKVVGCMFLLQVNEADEKGDLVSVFPDEDEDVSDSDEDEDNFSKSSKSLVEKLDGTKFPLLTHEEKQEQNEAWLPLAQFLGRLSNLKDLIYACLDQIPICILSSLHRTHPNSRLHMHTFNLRSLHYSKYDFNEVDPDEFALITSPCLYSIIASYSAYDTDGQVNYNEEAIAQMVIEAPRLKSVRMWHNNSERASLDSYNAVQRWRPPWQGFYAAKPGKSPKLIRLRGRLQSLTLDGNDLTVWSNCTDFSKLYTLKLQAKVSLDAIETLSRIAEDDGFKCLHTLALSACPFNPAEHIFMDDATSDLLQTLHPLKSLALTGFVAHKTFTTVLHRHGETLRKLEFISMKSDAISHQSLQKLQKRCPNLRELSVRISQIKGDKQEAIIYRSLSTLPRLKRAFLSLDCANLVGPIVNGDRLLDDEQKEWINKEILNEVVDSDLVLKILHTISSTYSLPYLKLEVFRDGSYLDVSRLERNLKGQSC